MTKLLKFRKTKELEASTSSSQRAVHKDWQKEEAKQNCEKFSKEALINANVKNGSLVAFFIYRNNQYLCIMCNAAFEIESLYRVATT